MSLRYDFGSCHLVGLVLTAMCRAQTSMEDVCSMGQDATPRWTALRKEQGGAVKSPPRRFRAHRPTPVCPGLGTRYPLGASMRRGIHRPCTTAVYDKKQHVLSRGVVGSSFSDLYNKSRTVREGPNSGNRNTFRFVSGARLALGRGPVRPVAKTSQFMMKSWSADACRATPTHGQCNLDIWCRGESDFGASKHLARQGLRQQLVEKPDTAVALQTAQAAQRPPMSHSAGVCLPDALSALSNSL